MTDLKAQLGTGEVQATLTLSGETLVEETCYPGVWLITHLGPEGDILVQLIEITKVPDLLMAQDSDITASADRLNQLLTAPAPGTMPPDRQEDVAHV